MRKPVVNRGIGTRLDGFPVPIDEHPKCISTKLTTNAEAPPPRYHQPPIAGGDVADVMHPHTRFSVLRTWVKPQSHAKRRRCCSTLPRSPAVRSWQRERSLVQP